MTRFRAKMRFLRPGAVRPVLAAVLAALMLVEPPLAASAQASVWSDRRQSAPAPTLASLPVGSTVKNILSGLPSARRPLTVVPTAAPSSPLLPLLSALPAEHVQVRSVQGGAGKPILILQDIHLNGEAQTHMAAALEKLANGNQVGVIGVEGAYDGFDLDALRAFPNRDITRRIVADYLAQGLIGAPSAAGILSENPAPLIGVDDRKLYESDVRAYLSARPLQKKSQAALALVDRTLQQEASTTLTEEQRRLLADWTAYREESAPLAGHVKGLMAAGARATPQINAFLSASAMENSFDFVVVESERSRVIESLISKLTSSDIQAVTRWAMDYRLGVLPHAEFYSRLESLCRRSNVALERFPSFAQYLRYVSLADGIRVERLLADVHQMESDAWMRLSPNTDQNVVREKTELLSLERRLCRFALTPDEWDRYRALRAKIPSSLPDAATFEAFYENADARSRHMVDAVMKKKTDGFRVLVIGGFHTPRVVELLQSRGLACAVVSPKLTRADTTQASAYLSVFAREKTPLEQWVRGEQLHISPRVALVGATNESGVTKIAIQALAAVAHALRGIRNLPARTLARVTKMGATGVDVEVTTPEGTTPFRGVQGKDRRALASAGGISLLPGDRPFSANRFGSQVAGWVSLLVAAAALYATGWVLMVTALASILEPAAAAAAPWILSALFASWAGLYFTQGFYFGHPAGADFKFRSLDPAFEAASVVNISNVNAVDRLPDDSVFRRLPAEEKAALDKLLSSEKRGPTFVFKGTLFADRERLARMPRFLQNSIKWHERMHEMLPKRLNAIFGEVIAYSAQGIHFTFWAPFQPLLALLGAIARALTPEPKPVLPPPVIDMNDSAKRANIIRNEITWFVEQARYRFEEGTPGPLVVAPDVANRVRNILGIVLGIQRQHLAGWRAGLTDQIDWPMALMTAEDVAAYNETLVARVLNHQDIPSEYIIPFMDAQTQATRGEAEVAAYQARRKESNDRQIDLANRIRELLNHQHAVFLSRAPRAGHDGAPARLRAVREDIASIIRRNRPDATWADEFDGRDPDLSRFQDPEFNILVRALWEQRMRLTQATSGMPDQLEWPAFPVEIQIEDITRNAARHALENPHFADTIDRAAFEQDLQTALNSQLALLMKRAVRAKERVAQIAADAAAAAKAAEPKFKPKPVEVRFPWLSTVMLSLPYALSELIASVFGAIGFTVGAIRDLVVGFVLSPVAVVRSVGLVRGIPVVLLVMGGIVAAVIASPVAAMAAAVGILLALLVVGIFAPTNNRRNLAGNLAALGLLSLLAIQGGRSLKPVVETVIDNPETEVVEEEPVRPPNIDQKGPVIQPITPEEVVTYGKQIEAMIAQIRDGSIPPGDPRVIELLRKSNQRGLADLALIKGEYARKAKEIQDAADLNKNLNTDIFAAVVDRDGRVAMNGDTPALFKRRSELAGYIQQKYKSVEYWVVPSAVPDLRKQGIRVTDAGKMQSIADVDLLLKINKARALRPIDEKENGPYDIGTLIRLTDEQIAEAKLRNAARLVNGFEPLPVPTHYMVRAGLVAQLEAGRETLTAEARLEADLAEMKALQAEKLVIPANLPPADTRGPIPGRLAAPTPDSERNRKPATSVLAMQSSAEFLQLFDRLAAPWEVRRTVGINPNPEPPYLKLPGQITSENRDDGYKPFIAWYLEGPKFVYRPNDGGMADDLVVGDAYKPKMEVPVTGAGVKGPIPGTSPQTPVAGVQTPLLFLRAGEKRFSLPLSRPNANDPTRVFSPTFKDSTDAIVTMDDGSPLPATKEVLDRLSNVNGRSWVVYVNAITGREFNRAEAIGAEGKEAVTPPLDIYVISPEKQAILMKGNPAGVGPVMLANGGIQMKLSGNAKTEYDQKVVEAHAAAFKDQRGADVRLDTSDDALILNVNGTAFDGPEVHVEERMIELAAAGKVRIEWTPSNGKWEPITAQEYLNPLPNSRSGRAIATKAVRYVRIQNDAGVALPIPKTIFVPEQMNLIAFDALGRPLTKETAKVVSAAGGPVTWYVDVAGDGRTANPSSLSQVTDPVFGGEYQKRLKELRFGGVAKRLAAREAERARRMGIQRTSARLLSLNQGSIFVLDGPVNPENPLSNIIDATFDPNDVQRMFDTYPDYVRPRIKILKMSELVYHTGTRTSESGDLLSGVVLRISHPKTGWSMPLFTDGKEVSSFQANRGVEFEPDYRVFRVYTPEETTIVNNVHAINDLRVIFAGKDTDQWGYARRLDNSLKDRPYNEGERMPMNRKFYPYKHFRSGYGPFRDFPYNSEPKTDLIETRLIRPAFRRAGTKQWFEFPGTLNGFFTTHATSPLGIYEMTLDEPFDTIEVSRVIANGVYVEDPLSKLKLVTFLTPPAGAEPEVMPWSKASPLTYDEALQRYVLSDRMDLHYDVQHWRDLIRQKASDPTLPTDSVGGDTYNMTVTDKGTLVVRPMILPTDLNELNNTRAALFRRDILTNSVLRNMQITEGLYKQAKELFHANRAISYPATLRADQRYREGYAVYARPYPGMPRGLDGYGIPKELTKAAGKLGSNPWWMYPDDAMAYAWLTGDTAPGAPSFSNFFDSTSGIYSNLTGYHMKQGKIGRREIWGAHQAMPILNAKGAPQGWEIDTDVITFAPTSDKAKAMFDSKLIPPMNIYADSPSIYARGWRKPLFYGVSPAMSADYQAFRLASDPVTVFLTGTNAGRETYWADSGKMNGYTIIPQHAALVEGIETIYWRHHVDAASTMAAIHGGFNGHTIEWKESTEKDEKGRPLLYPVIRPFAHTAPHASVVSELNNAGLNEPFPGGPIHFGHKDIRGNLSGGVVFIDAGLTVTGDRAERTRLDALESDAMAKVRVAGQGHVHVNITPGPNGRKTATADARTGDQGEKDFWDVVKKVGVGSTPNGIYAPDGTFLFEKDGKKFAMNGLRLVRYESDHTRPLEVWSLLETEAHLATKKASINENGKRLASEMRVREEGGVRRFNSKTQAVDYEFGDAVARKAKDAAEAWRMKVGNEGHEDEAQAGAATSTYKDGDLSIQFFPSPAMIRDSDSLPLDVSVLPDWLKTEGNKDALDDNAKVFAGLDPAKKAAATAHTLRTVSYQGLTRPESGGGALILTSDGRFFRVEVDGKDVPKGTTVEKIKAEMILKLGGGDQAKGELEAGKIFQSERNFSFVRDNGEIVRIVFDPANLSGQAGVEAQISKSVTYAESQILIGRLPPNFAGLQKEEFQPARPGDNPDEKQYLGRSLWTKLGRIPGAVEKRPDRIVRDATGYKRRVVSPDGAVLTFQVDDKEADGLSTRGSRNASILARTLIDVPKASTWNDQPLFRFRHEFIGPAMEPTGYRVFRIPEEKAPSWVPRRTLVTEYEIVTLSNDDVTGLRYARAVSENDGHFRTKFTYNANGYRTGSTTEVLQSDGKTWRPFSTGSALLTDNHVAMDGALTIRWDTKYADTGRVVSAYRFIDGDPVEETSGTQRRVLTDVHLDPLGEPYPGQVGVYDNGVLIEVVKNRFSPATGAVTGDRSRVVPVERTTLPGENITVDGKNLRAVPTTRDTIENGFVVRRIERIVQPDINRPDHYTVKMLDTRFDAAKAQKAVDDYGLIGAEFPTEARLDGIVILTYLGEPGRGIADPREPKKDPDSKEEPGSYQKMTVFSAGPDRKILFFTVLRPIEIPGATTANIRLRPTLQIDASGAKTEFFYSVPNPLGLPSLVVRSNPSIKVPGTFDVAGYDVLTDGQGDETRLTVDPKTGKKTDVLARPDLTTGFYRVVSLSPTLTYEGMRFFSASGEMGITNAGNVTQNLNPVFNPTNGHLVPTQVRITRGTEQSTSYTQINLATGESRTVSVRNNPDTREGAPVDLMKSDDDDPNDPFGAKKGGMIPWLLNLFGARYARNAVIVETLLFGGLAMLSGNPLIWIGVNLLFILLHLDTRTTAGVTASPRFATAIAIAHVGAIALTHLAFGHLNLWLALGVAGIIWSAVFTYHHRGNREGVLSANRLEGAENLRTILADSSLNLDIDSLADADRTGRMDTDLSEAFAEKISQSQDANERISPAKLSLWDAVASNLHRAITGIYSRKNLFAGSMGALMTDTRLTATGERTGKFKSAVPVEYLETDDETLAVERGLDAAHRLFGNAENIENMGLVLAVKSEEARRQLTEKLSVLYGNRVVVVDWNTAGRFTELDKVIKISAIADAWATAEIRLLIPAGVTLPDFFTGAESERARVRLFVLLFAEINAIVVEAPSMQEFTDTAKLVAEQA